MGPDSKLYAATDDGLIRRFPVNRRRHARRARGDQLAETLAGGSALRRRPGFRPAAHADNLIAWVTHTAPASSTRRTGPASIARLSGPNLETTKDLVINLPRSYRDHMTNQLAFGPDGASTSARGATAPWASPDTAWGNRSEHLLSAAILKLDVGGGDAAPWTLRPRTAAAPTTPTPPAPR